MGLSLQGGPWFGFFVPARTPRPIVDWLYAAAKQAFGTTEVRERFAKQGMTVMLGTPEGTTPSSRPSRSAGPR